MLATEREITNKLIKQKNQIKKFKKIVESCIKVEVIPIKRWIKNKKKNPEPCIAISQWGQSHYEVAFEFQHTKYAFTRNI